MVAKGGLRLHPLYHRTDTTAAAPFRMHARIYFLVLCTLYTSIPHAPLTGGVFLLRPPGHDGFGATAKTDGSVLPICTAFIIHTSYLHPRLRMRLDSPSGLRPTLVASSGMLISCPSCYLWPVTFTTSLYLTVTRPASISHHIGLAKATPTLGSRPWSEPTSPPKRTRASSNAAKREAVSGNAAFLPRPPQPATGLLLDPLWAYHNNLTRI